VNEGPDDVVVHIAAVLRVRVADDRASEWRCAIRDVEEAFERKRAAPDRNRGSFDHAQGWRSGFLYISMRRGKRMRVTSPPEFLQSSIRKLV
jgi:hypothetical protein